MKTALKFILGLAICLLCLSIYLNSTYYIEKRYWKYGEGFWIGDFLQFDSSAIILKNGEIYLGREKIAKVKYCIGGHLIIKSIKTVNRLNS